MSDENRPQLPGIGRADQVEAIGLMIGLIDSALATVQHAPRGMTPDETHAVLDLWASKAESALEKHYGELWIACMAHVRSLKLRDVYDRGRDEIQTKAD